MNNRVGVIDRNINQSSNSVVFLFLMLLFIYVSDDTVLFGTNSDSTFITLKYAYIISVTFVLTIRYLYKKKTASKSTIVYLGLLIGLILLSMIFNADIRFGYFYKIILLIYALNLVFLFPIKVFANIFVRIMTVLSIVSLFFFLLSYISPGVFRFLPIIRNTSEVDYYNAFFCVMPTYSYMGFIRNFGIFREPGVYQMYLIMALLLQALVLKEKALLRYLIFIATVITTSSTTGYIAVLFFMLLLTLNSEGLTYKKRIVFVVISVIGIIVLATTTSLFSLSSEDLYVSVFGKLTNLNRYSTVARLASITVNGRIAIDNPLFGAGLKRSAELFSIYSFIEFGRVSTNTNTIASQFSSHGFLYGFLWCYGIVKLSKKLSNRFWVLVFIIILILYFGENLTFSGFASLFLMYGIVEESKKRRKDYDKSTLDC